MGRLFRRSPRPHPVQAAELGVRLVALPLPHGSMVPPACTGVITGSGGQVRRVPECGRIALSTGEAGWCFHPGPYTAELVPFAAAPELGLQVALAVDSHDPRMEHQRFDLFLASEADGPIELAALAGAIEAALQRELAQGGLELPPCTSIDEWNAFRSGFNRLLYTRFGLVVDECMPVDLGDKCDFAQVLQARAEVRPQAPDQGPGFAQAHSGLAPAPAQPPEPARADAAALRRLFLELPPLMVRLRLAALPPGLDLFRRHQELLHRLELASLAVGTMPALELAAPNQPLAPAQQARRARHSLRAQAALDEAWALLARLDGGAPLANLFDDAERIAANLELDLAARRATAPEGEAP